MNAVTRRLLGRAGPGRRYLAAAVLAGLAVTAMIIAQAGLLAWTLARAGSAPRDQIGGAMLALLVAVAVRAGATYLGEAAALRAAASVKTELRSELAGKSLRLGPVWLAGQKAGELTTLAGTGLDTLDPFFARYLPQSLLAVTVPVAVLIRVGLSDWLSGLVIALTLPLIPVFAALVGMKAGERSRRQVAVLARLSGHFLDVVQGLTTLKVFGQAKGQQRVIARITEDYRVSVMATLRLAFLSSLVLELSAALATALVAVEIGLRLLYGHIGYESALVVLLLTPEAYLPLRNAGAAFHASADGTAAAERVFGVLDLPDAVPPRSAAARPSPPDPRRDPIVLDRVTVTYPGRSAPALDRVRLEIRPGDQITLTGPNGAGKSTLVHLLLRFAEPASGRVVVGGTDLRDVPVAAWRARIGWLPQRPALFGWSVAENIALGRPSARRDEVVAAAVAAGAAEFIAGLPAGFDTVLDEGAWRLSAGQRQKLALARLFLADRPVLILDEPTAHLDPVSTAELDRVIAELARNRTVITISHRDLSVLDRADGVSGRQRLLTLRDGRLTGVPSPGARRLQDVPPPARPTPAAPRMIPAVPAAAVSPAVAPAVTDRLDRRYR